jgi:hypothetical protein
MSHFILVLSKCRFSSIEIRFLSAHDCRKRKRKIHMTILFLATNIASFVVIVTSYLSNYNNLKFIFPEKSNNKRKKLILCSFISRMFWNMQIIRCWIREKIIIDMMMTLTITTFERCWNRMPSSYIEI